MYICNHCFVRDFNSVVDQTIDARLPPLQSVDGLSEVNVFMFLRKNYYTWMRDWLQR
jgi:hypothetical protein